MKKLLLTIALVLLAGVTMAKTDYALTETKFTSSELNSATTPTYIAIKNLSRTNTYYYVGNTGAAPYSKPTFSSDAVFIWEPVEEGTAGSYRLKKLNGTYMQKTSPKDFGTVENAAVFTTTNPTSQGSGATNFNGDGDSQAYINGNDDTNLVRFVNSDKKWINVQNGESGIPTYNTGTGGWTIHYVYAVEEAQSVDVTYNFILNGETKLTETVSGIVGKDFPNLPELPFGCKASKPEGKVPAENITKDIEVTVSLPFEYANSYDAIENWYYVKIKNANYLYHVDGQGHIALDKTTVVANKKKAYSWAFIGNPFDGFQIANKAAGEGYILSSSTTIDGNGASTYPVMTATPIVKGNNELWVLTASTNLENGFYIEQKGYPSNKMNSRDNKLAYWTAGADIGSTFTVELRPKATDELLALVEQAEVLLTQAKIGEGLGEYSTNYVGYQEIYDEIADYIAIGEIEEEIAEIYAEMLAEIIVSFSLNMPEKGKYYRFKSIDNKYLTAPESTGVQMALTEEATERSILYLDANGHLLVYGSGMYINGRNHAHIGYMDTYVIEASKTNTIGHYAIKPSTANYWHANDTKLDVYSGGTDEKCNWTIEEVTELPVTITEAKYATFYAPVAVTVPADVTAHTVTINGNWATLNEITGGVIPANTGVVLQGNADTYNFVVTNTTATVESDLLGTAAATKITTAAYVLGYINVAEEGQPEKKEVGFYTATMTNGAWLNNSHKAYLPADKANGAAYYSFRFGEGTTGVENVEVENTVNVIYDLTGRRVEAITAPGIYIVNGKKTLVK